MSSFLSELGGLTEGVGAEALAFAAGFAAARALEPAAVSLSQDAFHAAPVKRLDAETAAEAAAENYATYDVMATEASYSGYDASRFAYIYDVTLTAPGVGELLQMLRRQTINDGNFSHGLRKAKLEPMWDAAIADLQNVYLDPAILAVMLQRNVIPDQGQLPGVQLDTSGNVPRFPQVPIDAYAMAAKFGWSNDQLDAQTRIQGLPPGMDLVARMVFRNILQRGDFNLAAEQSNRRVEWADFEFDGYRQILTAEQYAELQLRGYLTADQRRAGTEKHGMVDGDSDLLYDVLGRGLALHSAFIAERRGGVFNGPTDQIPDWAMYMLQRGNLRPEVFNLAWAERETYPSYFVTKALLTDGVITAERGQELFLGLGWPEDVAQAAGTAFGATTTAKADPHIVKAQNQLWTTIHTLHKKGEITDAQATAALPSAGVDAAVIPNILAIWDVESTLVNAGVTPPGQ